MKVRNSERQKPQADPPREEAIIFADLASLCALPGFAHAIAFFCCRDNFVRFRSEVTTDDLLKLRTGEELTRTEISTLTGLLARQPADYSLPPPFVIDGYIEKAQELLREMHKALSSIWFKDFSLEKAEAGFDPFSTAEAMREPIFYGGDSAYYFQYREFAQKKYQSDDQWIEANKGFDIATAIKISEALGKLLTEKQASAVRALSEKPTDEWTLLPAFTFSLSELAACSGVQREVAEKFVAAFCVRDSDRNAAFTSLQEFNATTAQPIFHLEDEIYLLFQPYSLTEAVYEAPFFWMVTDQAYSRTALAHRGRYTEQLAHERLHHVFGSNTLKNIRIQRAKGDEIGEVDVLAVFGDRAIVLQAKSKRLTLEARKGNDQQIREDFKNAIQNAYDQALVCSKALIDGSYKLIDEGGNEIELKVPLKQIFPLCIVADHYPALAFQARQFLHFEESEAITAPLVTDVFALDAMTEMLETPLLFFSYLDLRRLHWKKIIYPNELTLLSAHLKLNLWVDSQYDMVSFEEGLSAHLDVAMQVRRERIPGARTPEGILTRLPGTPLGQIIAQIEANPVPATVDLGLQILAVSNETVKNINEGIKYICRRSAHDGTSHDFTVAFGDCSSGITVHCNDRSNVEAANSLRSHCALRKYSQKALSWFGLLLSPVNGSARLGLKSEGAWEHDSEIEAIISKMPVATPLGKFRNLLKDKKIGRNDPCPCGSGRKYKRCCQRLN